jgi:hypothetical protein
MATCWRSTGHPWRSPRRRARAAEIAAGLVTSRQVAVEDFELEPGEAAYDLAFASRVGVLDGRHPGPEAQARERIRAALVPGAPLVVV